METALAEMLNCGEFGLDGFIKFLRFFVLERSFEGAVFETKVKVLLWELDCW